MSVYTVGLDLGQSQDFSALAVVEHVWALPPGVSVETRFTSDVNWHHEFHVRALKRWPLGTSYVSVAEDVSSLMTSADLRDCATLIYDATGVGRAVGDLLNERARRRELGTAWPHPLTITAPIKEDLVSTLTVALQRGRLKMAPGLPLGEQLMSELQQFEQKIRQNGSTAYEFNRKGEGHGDLAFALLVALRWGEWVPGRGMMRHINNERGAA